MALKTNTKKVRTKIQDYIKNAREYIEDNGYTIAENYDLSNFQELCACIWEIFEKEKYYSIEYMNKAHLTYQDVFTEWAQGLALNLFDYYYNVSAVDLLGDILEQTETEKAKYTEPQAEKTLTYLIYREITANK